VRIPFLTPAGKRQGASLVGLQPELLVLSSLLSTQLGAALAVTLFHQAGAAGTAFLRMLLAGIALAAFGLPSRQAVIAHAGLLLRFALALAVMHLCIYEAYLRIPIGIASALEFAGPLTVAALGVRRPIDGLWVLSAACGTLLLVRVEGAAGRVQLLGVIFALGAGACWAAYIHLSRAVGAKFQASTGLMAATLVGAWLLAPIGISEAAPVLTDTGVLALACCVAVLSSALPFSLEMQALRTLSPSRFGVLASTSPAISAGAGFVVLAQSLSVLQVVGIMLVVAANAGAAFRLRRHGSVLLA
jgi:inner membrane transporter RhtA